MQDGALKKKKKSVAGQFPQPRIGQKRINGLKPNREDYGVDKYWVLLAVVKG